MSLPEEITKMIILAISDAQTFVNCLRLCKRIRDLFEIEDLQKQRKKYENIISIRRIRKHHSRHATQYCTYTLRMDLNKDTKIFIGTLTEMINLKHSKPFLFQKGKWKISAVRGYIYGHKKGYEMKNSQQMTFAYSSIGHRYYGIITRHNFNKFCEKMHRNYCKKELRESPKNKIMYFEKWKFFKLDHHDFFQYGSKETKASHRKLIIDLENHDADIFHIFVEYEKKCIIAFWITYENGNLAEFLCS
jgi:hypothetical protein